MFSGGALGEEDGWLALEEGAAKAALALTAACPSRGRSSSRGATCLTGSPSASLRCAPVRPVGKAAAQGAAVLADGLAGGRYAALVDCLGVRDASGTALDHLRVYGADRIRLR